MDDLPQHYRAVSGLDSTWQVDQVDLKMNEQRVKIRLEHSGATLTCSECGGSCSQADRARGVKKVATF